MPGLENGAPPISVVLLAAVLIVYGVMWGRERRRRRSGLQAWLSSIGFESVLPPATVDASLISFPYGDVHGRAHWNWQCRCLCGACWITVGDVRFIPRTGKRPSRTDEVEQTVVHVSGLRDDVVYGSVPVEHRGAAEAAAAGQAVREAGVGWTAWGELPDWLVGAVEPFPPPVVIRQRGELCVSWPDATIDRDRLEALIALVRRLVRVESGAGSATSGDVR
jgi:hypothetical protein